MITNEMKAKIFYLYPFASIMYQGVYYRLKSIDVANDKMEITSVGVSIVDTVRISGSVKLELTPLSEITDEDAIEVAKMHYERREEMINNSPQRYIKNVKEHVLQPIGLLPYYFADFLRSKGYALPYAGIDLFESSIAIPNNKTK